MTSLFNEEGKTFLVQLFKLVCAVLQVRTEEVDGYTAVQLGFDDKSEKNVSKALAGHFKRLVLRRKRKS
jgi:large subunit ribosomal protein L3